MCCYFDSSLQKMENLFRSAFMHNGDIGLYNIITIDGIGFTHFPITQKHFHSFFFYEIKKKYHILFWRR